MIGLIIFILCLFFYFNSKYRHISLVLYIGFLNGDMGGYNILTNQIIGMKNIDLALLFTFVVIFSNISKHKKLVSKIPSNIILLIKYFLLFILCSILFSLIHYDFPLFTVFRGARSYILILSLFAFNCFTTKEIYNALRIILNITIITSVLYILQIILGRPIMPYAWDYSKDESTGLIRLYNMPVFLTFFTLLSFTKNDIINKHISLYRLILVLAVICTLGRTMIATTFLGILMISIMNKGVKSLWKISLLFILLLYPFYDTLSSRFSDSGTTNDIERVKNADYTDYHGGEGTLIYRIAWIYERWDYLQNRPISEKIFGLGLIGEGEPEVYKKYNFQIGLKNDKGQVAQLSTPDIAYGDMLTHLGILGSILNMSIILYLIFYFFKNRKTHFLASLSFCLLTILLINSMSGSSISNPKNITMYFLILVFISKYKDRNNNEYKSINSNCNIQL